MEPFGLLLVLFGLPGAVWPYKIAKFGEAMDAIGSTRKSSEVEPAGWNVALTRLVSVGMMLFGLVMTFGGA
ncbi:MULTISPECIES: hypothetical protein [Halorussus]|uniref:hypothetical protein n=1 Tax=Halorussus TaxID=1070314 RepID=UPI0020A1C624|nr:hypothetical protein [Halorussus vallis]USZ77890.1 hypothetical protein NGM07_22180 [Halorussus vallis]